MSERTWIQSRIMLEHLPRLIYADAVGVRKDWNRWNADFASGFRSFIYHLFDETGDVVYIGKAWCPLYRLEKHSRKTWWHQVAHLHLYEISCESHREDPCGCDLSPVALMWEMHAIRDLQPRANIAGTNRVRTEVGGG